MPACGKQFIKRICLQVHTSFSSFPFHFLPLQLVQLPLPSLPFSLSSFSSSFHHLLHLHCNLLSGRLLVIITLVDTSLSGNGNICRSFVLNNFALGFMLVELGTLLCSSRDLCCNSSLKLPDS